MKNSDMPAMTIELSGFGMYAPEAHHGLTKREMFAMHIMAGLAADSECVGNAEVIARCAVNLADALLAELEVRK